MYDFLFDNLNRQIKAINETISAPYVQLFEQISVYSKATEQINAISNQLTSIYAPLAKTFPSKLAEDLDNVLQCCTVNYDAALYKSTLNSIERIAKQFRVSFNDELINSLKRIYENLSIDSAPDSPAYDVDKLSSDTKCTNEEAYVDLPLETVNKIEEKIVEIPQDICIKHGNSIVRIKSDFILNIIGLLVSIIFGILSCMQSSPENTEVATTIIHSLEQTIDLLSDIASNSSSPDRATTDAIQSLQESVETGNNLLQEVLRSLGSTEANQDNNSAFSDNQQDTESEKNYKQSL